MMTTWAGSANAALLANTHVEIISPRCEGTSAYETNPPASDGTKVIIYDSDHVGGGLCGTVVSGWAWKEFTRAIHVLYLDGGRELPAVAAQIKAEQAQTVKYANRMNLTAMVPETGTTIFSSGYGLSETCSEYLMFQPSAATDSINLTSCADQSFSVEYLDPATGAVTTDTDVSGGGSRQFTASAMRVVYLKRR
jgi:hypothetical protein